MMKIYHPLDIGRAEDWYICHPLLGIIEWKATGTPSSITTDLLPEWYLNLADEDYSVIDKHHEKYLTTLLKWIDSLGVTKSYLYGVVYTNEQKEKLQKYRIINDGYFKWSSDLIEDLISINLKNLYIETQNDTILIVYETWDTIFINSIKLVPEELKIPYVPILKFKKSSGSNS